MPRVSVSVREVALGCCLLGHSLSSSSSLSLHNTTHSALPWTLHPSQGTIILCMYCTVLVLYVLYYTGIVCTVLIHTYCTGMYSMYWYVCTVLYWYCMYCTGIVCTVLYWYCMYCTVLVLYVLYCTGIVCTVLIHTYCTGMYVLVCMYCTVLVCMYCTVLVLYVLYWYIRTVLVCNTGNV